MYYLLFALYLAIACFFITRISFIKNTRLTTGLILGLFLLKIAAGILIGWMSQKFYPQGNDYWGLNAKGWDDYNVMISDPKLFFEDIFKSPYEHGYDRFFSSTESYWNNLKNTLIIKFLAVCNIFSRGNYYINSIIFNFLGFFGHVALYRVFADIYKNKKWAVIAGCFLLPSTLYFTSGIHKDLIVFSMLGLYCYSLYFSLQYGIKRKYLVTMLITLMALLFVRNFVAIAIIPSSIALIITKKTKINGLAGFASVYLLGVGILLLVQAIKPSFQPLEVITQKQRDFFDLPPATSQIDTYVLEPNYRSLLKNAPQALDHSLLRPYVWEYPTKFLVPLAFELFIYHLLFLLMLIFYKKQTDGPHTFILFGLFISFTMLLFVGYIVPNIGSIVRYRSIYLPLLMTPVLCSINWSRFKRNKHITI